MDSPLTKRTKQDSRTIGEPEKSTLHKEISCINSSRKTICSIRERDTKNPMPIPFPSKCKWSNHNGLTKCLSKCRKLLWIITRLSRVFPQPKGRARRPWLRSYIHTDKVCLQFAKRNVHLLSIIALVSEIWFSGAGITRQDVLSYLAW